MVRVAEKRGNAAKVEANKPIRNILNGEKFFLHSSDGMVDRLPLALVCGRRCVDYCYGGILTEHGIGFVA